jgi:hypothetical protein
MLSGIVPVKLLSLTSLKIQEKHINNNNKDIKHKSRNKIAPKRNLEKHINNNNKDIKHKSRNKIAPKRNLDKAGLDYSQVPQTR